MQKLKERPLLARAFLRVYRASDLLHRAYNNLVTKPGEFSLAPWTVHTRKLDQRRGRLAIQRALEASCVDNLRETDVAVRLPNIVDLSPFLLGEAVDLGCRAVVLAHARKVARVVLPGEVPVFPQVFASYYSEIQGKVWFGSYGEVCVAQGVGPGVGGSARECCGSER